MTNEQLSQNVINAFKICSLTKDEFNGNNTRDNRVAPNQEIILPEISSSTLIMLCNLAINHFKHQETLLNIAFKDIIVVGDIHGNIFDLLRILDLKGNMTEQGNSEYFKNENTKILFLGDYVDRGDFSVEVITLLFSLSVRFPNQFFMIRGNHEFSDVNEYYGFSSEIKARYSNNISLWYKVNQVFNEMPIAALLNGVTFCVHGGISPHMTCIKQIPSSLNRPISSFINGANSSESSLLVDLMWSDPSNDIELFQKDSKRGGGCIFGSKALSEFLMANRLVRLLRAHESCQNGIETHFDKKCYTIFSTSNYENGTNLAGYLVLHSEDTVEEVILPKISLMNNKTVIKRSDIKYKSLDSFDFHNNSNINSHNDCGENNSVGRILMTPPKMPNVARPIPEPLKQYMFAVSIHSETPPPMRNGVNGFMRPKYSRPVSFKLAMSGNSENE